MIEPWNENRERQTKLKYNSAPAKAIACSCLEAVPRESGKSSSTRNEEAYEKNLMGAGSWQRCYIFRCCIFFVLFPLTFYCSAVLVTFLMRFPPFQISQARSSFPSSQKSTTTIIRNVSNHSSLFPVGAWDAYNYDNRTYHPTSFRITIFHFHA